MNWVALKMLTGDTAKYLGIIFGVAFATLLMTQQSSIFAGLLLNTTSQIRDIEGAEIWVMDPGVRFVDDLKPLADSDLHRVRGVEGVEWAVRLYKGLARARFEDGNFQQFILLGLDDASLVGAPKTMILGTLADLRKPDAVVIDEAGYRYLWPNEEFQTGRVFEMNDRRAVLVGVCKASPTFQSFPIVYTRYSQATRFVPNERRLMSFVLAQPKSDVDVHEVCARIREQTQLQAMTRDEFVWLTINYYLKRTGIPINFGITILLGFVVGAAIAGQTFYLFTIENLKQFGALKAMGVTNLRIVGMSLLQAMVVGTIGYGLGVGGAALFGVWFSVTMAKKGVPPAWFMTPYHLAFTAAAVLVIVLLASLVSIRKVLVLEPAIVFRG
jgi:putative ABC transport system permease protein